jgi:phenylpyruvate tautomerase
MPLLKIQTNKVIEEEKTQSLLKAASQRLATALGKPEQYMMVSVESGLSMMFASKPEPTAFAELRGIGLPASKTGELSRLICEMIEAELGISAERIYLNFADVPPNRWGWNGQTF